MKLTSKMLKIFNLNILKKIMVLFLTIFVFSVSSFGQTGFSINIFNYGIYLTYISLILLSALVFVATILYGDFKLKSSSLLIPSFALIGLLGTTLYSKEYREWATLLLLSFAFIVLLLCFKCLNNKFAIILSISIGLFIFTAFYIFYYRSEIVNFSSIISGKERLGYEFDNQNGVAAYAAVSFGLSSYIVLFFRKKIRFVFVLQILFSLIVGLTTGSRTFFFACFIFLFVYLFFVFKNHKLIYLLVIAVLTAVSVVLLNLPAFAFLKQRLIDAFGTIFGTAVRYDNATVERVTWIDYGIVLGSKNLLFGYGSLGFSKFSGVGTYSHSNFAEVLCDFGIFGFILFYLPLIIIAYRAFVYKKIDKAFIIGFISYYLIVSFSNVLYYKKMYYVVLALLFYLAYYDNTFVKKIKLQNIKTLVFVCDTMGPGGAEKVIATLSNQFSQMNIEVKIVGVGDTSGKGSFYTLNDRIKYITLSENQKRLNPLKKTIKLRRLLLSIRPDCVISFLPNGNIYACFSLLFTEIPHITSERNNPFKDPKGIFTRQLKKFSFQLSDGSVFQTKESMEYYGFKISQRSTIIKNPIALQQEPPKDFRKRNNVVLAVGRLIEQKNYYCLIDAFDIFNRQHKYMFDLRIYGKGPLENDLCMYRDTKESKNRISFVGSDPNWHCKEYLDSIFLLTSNYEGMPNSLLEAMALGIPSVSTDCPTGGPREIIVDGVNGYLAKVNNANDIAFKMNEALINSENIFMETRDILNEYSPSTISANWLNFIKQIERDLYE